MKTAFQPRRILVMKLRHIGDVLLVSPTFEALHRRFPDAELYACVNSGTEPVLQTHPLVRRVLAMPGPRAGWLKQAQSAKALRREKFDLVIDFTGSDRSAILSRLSGASQRWGYHRVKGFLGRNRLFTRTARRKKNAHVVEQQADLLEQMGVPSPNPTLTYHVRGEDRAMVDALLGPAQRLVHVHPVSRLLVKAWPAEFMARLLDHLSARGLTPVLSASPDPVELDWVAQLESLTTRPVLNLSGKLTLLQLAALAERAELFVGVDSAPLHLAAAVGTPVIGIFGPSSEILWGPWCDQKLILSREMDCRLPCKLKNACPHIACLREMTPDMVMPKVDQFLASIAL